LVTEQVDSGARWGASRSTDPQEMKKRKSSDHKVHLIACILQWAFGCSEFIAMENQSFAELTPLWITPLWYDTFHKGKQNFIRIF